MAVHEPWPHYGPIYYYDRYYQPRPYVEWVETTNVTRPYAPRVVPVDEERIRKIVREEIADLPIPFDVPDSPPPATEEDR